MWLVVFASGFTTFPTRGVAVASAGDNGWTINTDKLSISLDGKITFPTYTQYALVNLYLN